MSRRRPTAEDQAEGLTSEDRRIWARVASTVAPRPGRKAPVAPDAAAPAPSARSKPARPSPTVARVAPGPVAAAPDPAALRHRTRPAPEELEPRRQRRLARERDPIEGRIDLHGFGRFQAEDALAAFLRGAQARGCKAVLVITGQGRRGGGVIRASAGEWLQAPGLRGVVSGFSAAHRRHGGDGALYVTLKRL